jgi:hypothetical protein
MKKTLKKLSKKLTKKIRGGTEELPPGTIERAVKGSRDA